MSDPDWLGGIFADDALLDRLATRDDAGDEPLALVLGSLASFVDEPIGQCPAETARRRPSRGRRLAVAGLMAAVMSGAGFAAALALPDLPGRQDAPARTTEPRQPDRGGAFGSTSTGTPRPGGPSPTTVPAGAVRSTSPAGAGAAAAGPASPTTKQGAMPPDPARDGGEPPGLVSGPGTSAATPPSESDRSHHRGRPTTLPTPPGKGRTAHPPGGPGWTTPPGHSRPSTPPTG